MSHYWRELKLIKFNRLASHDWICMFSQISFSAKGTGEYQIHQAFLVISMVIKSLTQNGYIHQLLWGVLECWVGVIYLYSLTKGSLESMQTESIVCNLWIQGVWNQISIIGATDLLVIRARCYGIPLIKHMQRSGKGALRQFLAKNYLTAIFDTNKFMQGWDKSEVVHVWLRLLPKPDDPSTHKTIKCSS